MPGCRGILMLACVGALLLAGCGDDGGGQTIPPASAQAMKDLANDIDAATAAQECDVAQASTTELRNQVDDLPDGETKATLIQMVSRLDENLDEECPQDTGTSDEPTTTEPETTEVVPTTTTPTTVETTTTTTEEPEEEEEPETPEQPPGEGGGPQGPKPTPPGQSGGGPPTGGLEEE